MTSWHMLVDINYGEYMKSMPMDTLVNLATDLCLANQIAKRKILAADIVEGLNQKRYESPRELCRQMFMQNDHQYALYLHDAIKYAKRGIRSVCVTDADYPPRIKPLSGRPIILFYIGSPSVWAKKQPSVAVVGSRRPDAYGEYVTKLFTQVLCRHDYCIVSGLARGVDQMAHRTALFKKCHTIAVTAGGFDYVYPPEHQALFDSITQSGLVISEMPPWICAKRSFFPVRNRIISALSDFVVVTCAGKNSGTLHTASYAASQGKDVCAVPGRIDRVLSKGCHELIRDGAAILASTDDLNQVINANV